MSDITLQSNIHFINPETRQTLDSHVVEKLNQTLKTPDTEIVIKHSEHESELLHIDTVMANPAKYVGKEAFLSMQVNGKTVVLDFKQLSRDELVKALETLHLHPDLKMVEDLQQSASSLIHKIRAHGNEGQVFVGEKKALIEQLRSQNSLLDSILQSVYLQTDQVDVFLDKLLASGGELDQKFASFNLKLQKLSLEQNQLAQSVIDARNNQVKSVSFQGRELSIPDGVRQQLADFDRQIKDVIQSKLELIKAVQEWKDHLPKNLSSSSWSQYAQKISDGVSHWFERVFMFDPEFIKDNLSSLDNISKFANLASRGVKTVKAVQVTLQVLDKAQEGGMSIVDFIKKIVTTGKELTTEQKGFFHSLEKVFNASWISPEFQETILKKLHSSKGTEAAIKTIFGHLSKMGPRGAQFLVTRVSLGNVLSGISMVHYTATATGLNYVNETIDGVAYRMRPSVKSCSACAIAALVNGVAVALTPAGVATAGGASLIMQIFAVAAEMFAESFLADDKEKLTEIHRHLLKANTGAELRLGIQELQKKYGSLENIQDVLGLTGDGKDLAGTLMNQIAKMAAYPERFQGGISKQEAQQAIEQLLKGLDQRWLSDDDTAYGFMLIAKENKMLDTILPILSSENRVKLYKMMAEGVTTHAEGDFLIDLLKTETDLASKGQMMAYLLSKYRITDWMAGNRESFKQAIQAELDAAYQSGPDTFKALLNHLKLDGVSYIGDLFDKSSSRNGGKLLAWMVQAKVPAEEIKQFINHVSGFSFTNDDVTRLFLKELQHLNIDLQTLKTSIFDQKIVWQLFINLEDWWTNDKEYAAIEKLASLANVDTRVAMIKELFSGPTFESAEKTIAKILDASTIEERKLILEKLDVSRLGQEIDKGRLNAKVMSMLSRMPFPKEELNKTLNSYFDGVLNQGYIYDSGDTVARKFIESLDDEVLRVLDADLRTKLFQRLDSGSTNVKEYAAMSRIVQGASAYQKSELIQYLLNQTPTTESQLKLIKEILKTSSESDYYYTLQYLDNVGKLKQLIDEMAGDQAAVVDITVRLIKASDHLASKPIKGMVQTVLGHLAYHHRSETIRAIIAHTDLQADTKRLFRQIDTSVLKDMCQKLMVGRTNTEAENAIYEILSFSSWASYAELMADTAFKANLASELSSGQYQQLEKWVKEIPEHR